MVDDFETRTDTAATGTLAAIAATAMEQHATENFPVALRILPRTPREKLARLYAYARFVDDIGDTAPGDRPALLDLVERDVRRLPGQATLAPVAALGPDLLPQQPLLDLIEANRRDQTVTRYASFDDLLDYCSLSAAPVGRLVLHLAGVHDEVAGAESDAVCAALQVLEHCQDVAEDARAGRIYLPLDDLTEAGVDQDELIADRTSPALAAVVGRQVGRAEELLHRGRPLLRRLSGWSRVAVTGYVAGGLATVRALRRADFDVVPAAVRPGKIATVGQAMRLAVRP
ncbi:MAG TPA: squalene/phytoene synthase family protein [Jatrophihabitans sp.]|uniref:squalene/phytoene synthase family protein n=1 Tax=Jatrophihabitans sp. TaxID=1932789 RepID=UPI002DFE46CA|nr:squalene/phytoene synthase family protein [Jatrophihabitans sp.]